MASKPQKQQQLGELLQVKQEPFVLDHYLFERGYLKKSLSLRLECSRFGCCNNAIIANPYKSYAKRVPRCSKILRAILKKFTRRNGRRKVTSSGRKSVEEEVSERSGFCSEALFDKDESSLPSSSDKCRYDDSVLADTLEGLRLGNMTEDETCLGGEFQCHVMANSKQLSPVSVLEQVPQSRKLRSREKKRERESETITCTARLPNKLVVVADSTALSDSLCQLRSHESISGRSIETSRGIFVDDDPMTLLGSEKIPSQQFAKSKRVLQQTRQLLFDCVREVVESHVINNGGVVGPEELGSLILERMKAWDSHIRNESNILTSSSYYYSDVSEQEWNIAFESEKKEVCSEIGDFIAEALINEIVDEILQK